jgi:nicotinamide phosphoribosyltransferase
MTANAGFNCVSFLAFFISAAEKVFGADVNKKGYKVIRGCGVIQGDGVSYKSLGQILDAVLAAGYSAQNCAFGMGGGLLQKLNRDSMSLATKLSHVVYLDGSKRYEICSSLCRVCAVRHSLCACD